MGIKAFRCMVYKEGGLWVAVCLDLCLAAQDYSSDAAVNKLNAQINDYVSDGGINHNHECDVKTRRTPFTLWVRYAYIKLQGYFVAERKEYSYKEFLFSNRT